MSEIKEKLDELEVKGELAKEEAEEKIEDLKDDVGAAIDNVKEEVEQKVEEAAVKAELAKEEAEEKIEDLKDEAGAAADNTKKELEEKASKVVEDIKNAAKDIGEDLANSSAGKAVLGEDGKFDGEDVKRLAGDAVDAGKKLFGKLKDLVSKDKE